jgi:hypothetical protein
MESTMLHNEASVDRLLRQFLKERDLLTLDFSSFPRDFDVPYEAVSFDDAVADIADHLRISSQHDNPSTVACPNLETFQQIVSAASVAGEAFASAGGSLTTSEAAALHLFASTATQPTLSSDDGSFNCWLNTVLSEAAASQDWSVCTRVFGRFISLLLHAMKKCPSPSADESLVYRVSILLEGFEASPLPFSCPRLASLEPGKTFTTSCFWSCAASLAEHHFDQHELAAHCKASRVATVTVQLSTSRARVLPFSASGLRGGEVVLPPLLQLSVRGARRLG